jgi:uncharacterized membrane protein YphA (DoxX/SURF4 family)
MWIGCVDMTGRPDSVSWWFNRLLLTAVSVVFLVFGILMLIGAYTILVPHFFVLTFFAANFIILVSGAVLLGYVIQMVQRLRRKQAERESSKEG